MPYPDRPYRLEVWQPGIAGVRIAVFQRFYEGTWKAGVNEAPILEFKIPAGDTNIQYLTLSNEIKVCDGEGVELERFKFLRKNSEQDSVGLLFYRYIYEGLLNQLQQEVIGSYTATLEDGKTLGVIIDELMDLQENTNPIIFAVTDMDEFTEIGGSDLLRGKITYLKFKNLSILEAINSILAYTAGFITVDSDRRLKWLNVAGENNYVQIRFKKNLVDLDVEETSEDLVTRLYFTGSQKGDSGAVQTPLLTIFKAVPVHYWPLNGNGYDVVLAGNRDLTPVGVSAPPVVTDQLKERATAQSKFGTSWDFNSGLDETVPPATLARLSRNGNLFVSSTADWSVDLWALHQKSALRNDQKYVILSDASNAGAGAAQGLFEIRFDTALTYDALAGPGFNEVKVVVLLKNDAGADLVSLTSPLYYSSDVWHNVIVTHQLNYAANTNRITLYIDGLPILGASYATPAALTSIDRFNLGVRQYNGFTNWFKGRIDDVKIYDILLSPTDTVEIYAGGSSYIDDLDAQALYGVVSKVVSLPSVQNPDTLFKAALAYLEDFNHPRRSFQIGTLDLGYVALQDDGLHIEGLELTPNGTFTTNLAGWLSDTSLPGNEFVWVAAAAQTPLFLAPFDNGGSSLYTDPGLSLAPGSEYVLVYTVDLLPAGAFLRVRLGGVQVDEVEGPSVWPETRRLIVVAGANSNELLFQLQGPSGNALQAWLDGVSIRRLTPQFEVGYGPELVVNGDFATGDLTGWTPSAFSGGPDFAWGYTAGFEGIEAKNVPAAVKGYIEQALIGLTVGKYYLVKLQTTNVGQAPVEYTLDSMTRVYSGPWQRRLGTGSYQTKADITGVFKVTGGDAMIRAYTNPGFSTNFWFGNFSVREILAPSVFSGSESFEVGDMIRIIHESLDIDESQVIIRKEVDLGNPLMVRIEVNEKARVITDFAPSLEDLGFLDGTLTDPIVVPDDPIVVEAIEGYEITDWDSIFAFWGAYSFAIVDHSSSYVSSDTSDYTIPLSENMDNFLGVNLYFKIDSSHYNVLGMDTDTHWVMAYFEGREIYRAAIVHRTDGVPTIVNQSIWLDFRLLYGTGFFPIPGNVLTVAVALTNSGNNIFYDPAEVFVPFANTQYDSWQFKFVKAHKLVPKPQDTV